MPELLPFGWIACSAPDKISSGLKLGEELQLEMTICDEVWLWGATEVLIREMGFLWPGGVISREVTLQHNEKRWCNF